MVEIIDIFAPGQKIRRYFTHKVISRGQSNHSQFGQIASTPEEQELLKKLGETALSLLKEILAIQNVSEIVIAPHWIQVWIHPESKWETIEPPIIKAIERIEKDA